jgi:hypothetical protein
MATEWKLSRNFDARMDAGKSNNFVVVQTTDRDLGSHTLTEFVKH